MSFRCWPCAPHALHDSGYSSQWKGLNSSQAALASMHGVFLSSRGVTGPKYVIEGPNGLAQALGKTIQIDWSNMKLDCFDRLALKTTHNTAIPAQSAVFCTLKLHKAHPFNAADVVSIEAHVFQDAYDFTGGGRFGPKKNVHTKEVPTTAFPTSWLSHSLRRHGDGTTRAPPDCENRCPRSSSEGHCETRRWLYSTLPGRTPEPGDSPARERPVVHPRNLRLRWGPYSTIQLDGGSCEVRQAGSRSRQ